METITRTRKLELYQGTDQMGRGFIAGKTGTSKSMCLKGIAVTNNYRYIGEEQLQAFTFPMTCQDLLNTLKSTGDVNGIVLDFPMVHEKLTDFQDYKWNIPVWHSIQLKRDGSFRFEDITTYNLLIDHEFENSIAHNAGWL